MKEETRSYQQVARARAREERRWRILRAAWELFGTRRYEDVTMEDIADRAGVGERTIYRLVGPKESLLDVWVEEAEAKRSLPGGANGSPMPTDVQVGRRRWTDETGSPLHPGDLDGFAQALVGFYEEWGDTLLNLLRQEQDVAQFAALLAYGRRRHRDNVDQVIGGPVADDEAGKRRRALLYAITDVHLWKLLRVDHGLTETETRDAILEAIECLAQSEP